MASSSSPKIHLFKKSAIEAGTPEDYYLDPSDNLMKITSDWSVVEHEDVLELNFYMFGNGERVFVMAYNLNFVEYILVGVQNEEKDACFDHEDGTKQFHIVVNPNFLKIGLKGDPIKLCDGTVRMFISKLKLESCSS